MFVMSTVIITDYASLRVFNVSKNSIGDDGMSLISSEIQLSNILTELWVGDCKLSVKGILP